MFKIASGESGPMLDVQDHAKTMHDPARSITDVPMVVLVSNPETGADPTEHVITADQADILARALRDAAGRARAAHCDALYADWVRQQNED